LAHDGQQRAHEVHRAHHELPPEVQDKMRWAEKPRRVTPAPPSPWPELRWPLRDCGRLPLLAAEIDLKHTSPGRITRRHSPPSLHGAHARPRPADTDFGRDAAVELPPVADRLYRDFRHERLWPDFRGIHLLEAIADFQRRERRYGGLSEDPASGRRSGTGQNRRRLITLVVPYLHFYGFGVTFSAHPDENPMWRHESIGKG